MDFLSALGEVDVLMQKQRSVYVPAWWRRLVPLLGPLRFSVRLLLHFYCNDARWSAPLLNCRLFYCRVISGGALCS